MLLNRNPPPERRFDGDTGVDPMEGMPPSFSGVGVSLCDGTG